MEVFEVVEHADNSDEHLVFRNVFTKSKVIVLYSERVYSIGRSC